MARGHQILSEEILEGVKGGLPKAPTTNPIPDANFNAEGVPPVIEGSFHGSLEEAANLLLSIITPSIRDYAFEVADIVLKIPRWQLLLGTLMAQHQSGALTAPSIDPSWRQVEMLTENSVCQYCKQTFTPKKYGQRYCSNLCGDKARGEVIRKENERREKFREADLKAQKEAGVRL